MGIMLNMVSPPERSTAISVTTFMMMSFGLLPAPYVYGAIVCLTAKTHSLGEHDHHVCKSPWGMRIVSFVTIIGGIALFLSFLLRRVSQEKGAERVKEKLIAQKDQLNLSVEQI